MRRSVPLLALLAALAGCGSSGGSSGTASTTSKTAARTVDQQQVEQGITTSLSTSSVKVTKATCPADVPVQVGGTFTCSVSFSDGAAGKVTVTQKGANHYSYAIEAGSVQIPGSEVDAQLEKQLAAQGIPNATVNCPQNIIVKTGTTVTCDVAGASGAVGGTVTFTFSSDDGEVDPSSVKS